MFLENLCVVLESLEADLSREIEEIKLKWIEVFTKAASDEWNSNSIYAEELSNKKLFGPMQEYIEALEAENNYKKSILLMTEEKVFDQDCTIKDVFVNLNSLIEVQKENGESCNRVVDTKQYIIDWTQNSENGMIVVKGEPGSGKSTLLKMIAKELIQNGQHVVYFNLYKLPFSTRTEGIKTLEEQLDELLWYKTLNLKDDKNVIYILDGLDEIKNDVWDNAKNLTQLLSLSHFCNIQKVILSGREKIIEFCSKELDDYDILTILPLVLPEKLNEKCYIIYNDNADLDDKRVELWNNINNSMNLNISIQEILDKTNLDELSVNPLLLFLLALTLKNNPDSIEKINNSCQLYYEILRCVYARKYSRAVRYTSTFESGFNSYFRILSAIGACAWQNNSREIEVSKIRAYCEMMGLLSEFSKWFEEENQLKSSKLFLMFFAHHNQKEDVSTFEFLHKSFYEYLSVVEIVFQIDRISKLDPHKINLNIKSLTTYNFFGKNYISTDFLYNYLDTLFIGNEKQFLNFTEDVNLLIRQLDPRILQIESSDIGINTEFDFEEFYISRILDSIRFVRNNIWLIVQYVFVTLEKFNSLIQHNKLIFKNILFSDHIVDIYCCSNSVFDTCEFVYMVFSNIVFNRSKFTAINAKSSHFHASHFKKCEFKNSKFELCHFETCDFSKARFLADDFEYAYMEGAYFTNSEIKNSQFSSTYLSACDFENVVFDNVVFKNCNFVGSNFSGVKIKNTKFIDCDFSYANMSNVKLKSFRMADEKTILTLRKSYLEEANWNGLSDQFKEKLKC